MRRLAMIVVAGGAALVAGGCASPALRGRVIEGDASYLILVSANDPRLEGTGVAGASLMVTMDPMKLNRKTIGSGASGPDGYFEVPISEHGGGFLEIDVAMTARKKGCEPAEGYFRLPGSNRRVLVVLGPGKDRPTGLEREDPSRDVDRFWGGR